MMTGRSKSGLFLIELLVVIAVFAVCAAVCTRIFASAHLTARESRDISRALNIARNAAEGFKLTGDIGETAALLGGSGGEIYYDADWKICASDNAAFVLRLSGADVGELEVCDIYVRRVSGGEIYSLTAVSRAGELYG